MIGAIALGVGAIVAPVGAWWVKRPTSSAVAPSDGAPAAPELQGPAAEPAAQGPALPVMSLAGQQQRAAITDTAALLKGVGTVTGVGGLGVFGAAWAAGQGVGEAAFAVSKTLGLGDAEAHVMKRAAGLAGAGAVVAGPVGAVVAGGVQLAAEGLSALIGVVAGKDVEKAVRNAVSQLDPTRPDTVPGKILRAPVELIGLIGDSLTGKLPPQPELKPEVAAREEAAKLARRALAAQGKGGGREALLERRLKDPPPRVQAVPAPVVVFPKAPAPPQIRPATRVGRLED